MGAEPAVVETPQVPAGHIVAGKYRLFACLGQGGMADVFLGVAHGLMGFNKLVVVKRLRANIAEESKFVEMFLDEARLAARLNHPNVIHTYEVGEETSGYFIAMEYLDGQPLSRIIKSKKGQPVSVGLAASIVSEALAGLHYAHELADYDGTRLNVIHRDVSPQNIFVTYDGQVKLVDFGIAKAARNKTQTEAGTLKGKVAYMPPEQARGVEIDRRADLFSMGLVLWELLTGRRYFTGDLPSTLGELLTANTPMRRVSELVLVDPELDAIVARATERDPVNRFSSAMEMRQAIDAFLKRTGQALGKEEVGSTLASMFREHRERVQAQIRSYMATSSQSLANISASASTLPSAGSGSPPAAVSAVNVVKGRELPDPTQSGVLPTLDVPEARASVSELGPPASPSARKFPVAALAVIGLLVVGAGAWALGRGASGGTSSGTPSIVRVEPVATAAPVATPAAPDGSPIAVRISTQPAQATVLVDGKSVANPFAGEFPRDDRTHTVSVMAPGFVRAERTVTFDRDLTLEVALEHEAIVANTPAARPHGRGFGRPAPRPAALAPTEPAHATAPDPGKKRGSMPELDQDPWKPNVTRPQLDRDPYGQ